jgi:hypothetical protein
MPYRSTELNANLTKGSANVADVVRLLSEWRPGEDRGVYLRRIVDENVLGRTTRARARDVAQNVLARRYLPSGDTEAAARLASVVTASVPADVLRRLLYYHAALAEHLLYRVASGPIYESRFRGVELISVFEIRRFIAGLSAAGLTTGRYSESVVEKLAGSVLTALRDFRLVIGTQRKRIAPVHVPHEVVGYVVHSLREEDASAKHIVEHPDWRLFLLTPAEVESAILDADRHGHFRYQSAGDVHRFDWFHDSVDSYVNTLTGSATARA